MADEEETPNGTELAAPTTVNQSPAQVYHGSKLVDMIGSKYPSPAYVLLSEVREGTGYYSGGSADAMAFGVWPSRGIQVIGFECKSYRGDWTRELKKPAKADGFASMCDQWWVVTAPNVARIEEIPPAWGWYEASARGLKMMKMAPTKEGAPVDRSFLMSVMRNFARSYVPKYRLTELTDERVEQYKKSKTDERKWDLERLQGEVNTLKDRITDFEKASGIKIADGWNHDAERSGKAVKAILDLHFTQHAQNVAAAATKLNEVVQQLATLPPWLTKETE